MPRRSAAATLVVLWLLALAGCRSSARGAYGAPYLRAHEPRVPEFDVLGYSIALALEPETRSIDARCTVRLRALERALDEVRLDLVGLEVRGARDSLGRALEFRHEGGELALELAQPLAPRAEAELTVEYGGSPARGLWFAGRRPDGSGPTLVFSHGQTEGARGWFPCFDEPSERAALELELDVPAAWTVVASGARAEEARLADGARGPRRIERWALAFEHPSYLVGFVAGELVQRDGLAGDVPLAFLAEPRFEDWIEPTFAETDEILAFLEEWIGLPYPYPKYSQAAVDDFPWGGMENISASTLTPQLLADERAHRDQPPHFLVAHEAVHQWFGNLLTCADWSHLWLNEGFATYLTLLYVEATRGTDEFRAQMRDAQEAYLREDVGRARRPTVWNVWREPDDVFDTRPYQGGAARLHLLRHVVGDEAFLAGVRAYARENAGRSVVTDDLRRALERASGRDLSRFFRQWLHSSGYPELALAWEWEDGVLRLALEQLQTGEGTPEAFELSAEVEVRDARGARRHGIELDERRERFELDCPEPPLYVRFDPDGWIPKRVREEKRAEEWIALAGLSEDVNARREAVLALGPLAAAARERGSEGGPELAALVERVHSDRSEWVRADAATALGVARGRAADDALRRAAVEDPAPRARVAALHALRAFGPDPGLARLAESAFDDAPSWQSQSAAASLVAYADPARGFDFLCAALELESPHDVLAGQLLRHLGELADPRVPAELRRWAAEPSLAPTARAVAVEALAAQQRERLEASRAIAPLLEEPSFHLRRSAVRALAALADDGARRALSAYYGRARSAEERRVIEAALARGEP